MKNSILNLVYNTHVEGKERSIFMSDYIRNRGAFNIYDKTHHTLEFFYKHIPVHFAYEEIVIKELLESKTLSNDESANMYKILDEHKTLKTNFEDIKAKAAKLDKDAKIQMEDFLAIVNETIYSLIKHAEFEDKYFFPVADEKVDCVMINAIGNEITKIVF